MAAVKTPDTWAGTVKAIGLKALTTGKFWQFCFLGVALAFAYRIESGDWVRIANIVLAERWVSVLGWVLATIFVIGGIAIFKIQRTIYSAEITRLAAQRNELQERLSGTEFASSAAAPAPTIKALPVALDGEST